MTLNRAIRYSVAMMYDAKIAEHEKRPHGAAGSRRFLGWPSDLGQRQVLQSLGDDVAHRL